MSLGMTGRRNETGALRVRSTDFFGMFLGGRALKKDAEIVCKTHEWQERPMSQPDKANIWLCKAE